MNKYEIEIEVNVWSFLKPNDKGYIYIEIPNGILVMYRYDDKPSCQIYNGKFTDFDDLNKSEQYTICSFIVTNRLKLSTKDLLDEKYKKKE